MKDSNNILKKLGLMGVGLCAACCLLTIATVLFGIGSLTVFIDYLVWAGIMIIATAGVLYGKFYRRKQRASSCVTDCVCKEAVLTDASDRRTSC